MFTEDLAVFFAEFGEDFSVQGADVRGIFSASSQLVLEDVLVTEPILLVAASVAAAEGGLVVVRGSSYRIRQVLDQPPDGALRNLVLSKV